MIQMRSGPGSTVLILAVMVVLAKIAKFSTRLK